MTDPLKVRVRGPIAPYADGFRKELARRGYAESSVVNQLKLVAHLSRWLDGRGLAAEALTVDVVDAYIETRRAAGYGWQPTGEALGPLVGYPLELAVVVELPARSASQTVVDEVAERYRCYLVRERGLAAGTVAQYMAVAHRFLSERPPCALDLGAITASDVTGFVARQCQRRSVAFSKTLVNGVRSLLRFLYLDGSTALPLAQAVPAVAG